MLNKHSKIPGGNIGIFIAPDGSYLVFQLEYHLHVSYRRKDGTWIQAQKINMDLDADRKSCPIVSPDGKFLFFIAHQGNLSDVYWMDARIIEELKSS